MYKLQLIRSFLLIVEFLVIAYTTFRVYLMYDIPEGVFFPVHEVRLSIASREATNAMYPFIPKPGGNEPVILESTGVEMSMETTTEFRLVYSGMVILMGAYLILLLEITKRVVRDVKEQSPFNSKNIFRVKLLGSLIAVAPGLEYLARLGLKGWIRSKFEFHDMVLHSEAHTGWVLFTVGLTVLVIGIAFNQGQKLQEENELTI